MIDNNEWFVSWFDSKYYHILYSDRTDYEAHNFIYQLKNHLSLDSKEKVLDLGCGRGRHSKTLSEFFKTLDGIDISKENIDFAKSNKSKNQNFYLSDMRNFKMSNSYGYIFNLFTRAVVSKSSQKLIHSVRILSLKSLSIKAPPPRAITLLSFLRLKKQTSFSISLKYTSPLCLKISSTVICAFFSMILSVSIKFIFTLVARKYRIL